MLSYIDAAVDVTEADAYAAARGWTNWTGDNALKTAAIRRSQDYIAATYNSRWTYDWDESDIPEEVQYAIIEGARRELVVAGSLSPDVTLGKVKTRVRVEGAVDVTYASASGASSQRPDISIIASLLAPFITNGGGSVDLLRV
jgi:DnaT-like ssDNA binding protein